MRMPLVPILAMIVTFAGTAGATTPSTSAVNPSPVDASGVVAGAFPGGKTAYYFAVDVKPGDLLTQIAFEGGPGAKKSVDLALLDPSGRAAGSYWTHGEGVADERTRSFPIDTSGKQVVRVEVEGPSTARYRVELGGSALATPPPAGGATGALSRSLRSPTPVAADGVISGPLPGTDKQATYYLVVDVQAGDLLTQISAQSRAGADKSLSFELLRADAGSGESYWVHGTAAAEEKTRSFAIDTSGKQIIRLATTGPENGSFKVELGGTAIAVRPAGEPGPVAAQAAR